MAIDYIPITITGAEGPNNLRDAIESLRKARHEIERIQGWMVHTQDGADWSALEQRFGLPPGVGGAVFTLIDGTLQVLNGASSGYAAELMGRVG